MKILINGQTLHQSNILSVVFVSSFRGSKNLLTIRFSNVYFFEYEHLKSFVWKDDIFACKWKIGYRAYFPNWRW